MKRPRTPAKVETLSAFDRFVVGPSNRVAVAAACAVAESPGAGNNPLVIHGARGLGKTHLLKGIAELARKLRPHIVSEYITGSELVERFSAIAGARGTDAWVATWTDIGLFLIDDAAALRGHTKLHEALLSVVTAALDDRRQIVITNDRPLTEIGEMDERLVAKLQSGVIVELGAPDPETRTGLLRRAAGEIGIDPQDPAVTDVARLDARSAHELRGALNEVVARRSVGMSAVRVEDVARARGLSVRSDEPRKSVAAFKAYLAGDAADGGDTADNSRARLMHAIDYWLREGYRALPLERALASPKGVNVEALIASFAKTVERLRALERQATAVNAGYAGLPIFREADALPDAEEWVRRMSSGEALPPPPSVTFIRAAFEISTSNQAAATAVDAVVERPGKRFNPLVLCGAAGSGKSHLAHAAGNELSMRNGAPVVVGVLNARHFSAELGDALTAGKLARVRERYRSVEVLIIENLEALASQARAQEELVSLIDALKAAGKQMIVTSEQLPRASREFDPGLRVRLDGGLTVMIEPPDRVLRERIVLRTLEQHTARPDPAVSYLLAEAAAPSVRDLMGITHRVIAAASASKVPVTAEFAREQLSSLQRARTTGPSVHTVDSAFVDEERIVWHWPDPSERFIEDIR